MMYSERMSRSFFGRMTAKNTSTEETSAPELMTAHRSIIIDEKAIEKIPTAVDCLEKITGSIASLPIYLYKEDADGSVEKIRDDYRLLLLNNEPNEHLSSFDFKKQMAKDFLLHGRTHSYIEKDLNEITGIYPLMLENIIVNKYINDKGFNYSYDVTYTINQEDADKVVSYVYKPYELLSILRNTKDGVKGKGILEQGLDTFTLAIFQNEYNNNVFRRGALPLGVLETDSKLTEPAAKRLRESWNRTYSGSENSGKTVILEEGLKYKAISLSPNDLALDSSKESTDEDICNLFGVPYSLVLGKKGYGDAEQDNLHFLKYCLSPILKCIEEQLDRSLLLEEEKENGYYFRFDITELLRMTESETYKALGEGMKTGIVSINEARARVDLPPVEQDFLLLSLGNIFYDMDKNDFIVPNTGQGIDANTPNDENDKEEVDSSDDSDNISEQQ